MRKISKENLDELEKIFEVTGGLDWFDKIEDESAKKAKELGMEKGDDTDKKSEYFTHVYRYNNADKHRRK